MTTYVALLRSVNVTGRSVKMNVLKALYEAEGMANVHTVVQTGNVIFESDKGAAALQKQLEAAFEKAFGFHSALLLRTAAQLRAIAGDSPFAGKKDYTLNWIVVMFLSDAPGQARLDKALESYSGHEELVLKGTELHIYYGEGIGRSKLWNANLEKKLGVVGTARNWNTVLKIAAAVEE